MTRFFMDQKKRSKLVGLSEEHSISFTTEEVGNKTKNVTQYYDLQRKKKRNATPLLAKNNMASGSDAFQPGNQGELGYVLTAQPTK